MYYNFRWPEFWDHVRGARATQHLSQVQLGKRIGVGGSRFSQLEKKQKPINAERFLILCRVLFLEPDMYLEELHDDQPEQMRFAELAGVEIPHDDYITGRYFMPGVDDDFIVWEKTRKLEGELAEVFHTEIGWIIDPRPLEYRS